MDKDQDQEFDRFDGLKPYRQFRLGSRTIKATKATSLSTRRQVYRLHIERPTIFDYIPIAVVRRVLHRFVDIALPWAKTHWPEWFLPPTVILKRMKGYDDPDNLPDPEDMRTPEEKFEYEKQAYLRLRPVQGTAVPRIYGEAEYSGFRALVLSDVGGVTLHHLPCDTEVDDLKGKIEAAFRGLAACGVKHGDPETHNVILVDDFRHAIVVDFEYAEFVDTEWDTSPSKEDASACWHTYIETKAVLLESRRLSRMTPEKFAALRREEQNRAEAAALRLQAQRKHWFEEYKNSRGDEGVPYVD
ncbi:hypothetical protein SODALDRAFT_329722 [Sodiomyces alkalinus F11]|uniref:Uncharacterized protein n=1 Tax=Sodiomyces alkalinus (strain CBS 110278 / VKM F-3762 / F11) TaxID=1314773 RepID=A0A3N2PJK2_SODAK|nr:hypothetical protein SODALDRAFT_329722 [Sodiomyces alkalinus F11]ROT34610.1 hypothetical protein SODALDRAFT_329722 [Sodiomyces alkalinus F11]